MKVNISPKRIFHLILLIFSTYVLSQILIRKLEWTPLSAYGLGCTIVVQVNNAILTLFELDTLGDRGVKGKDAHKARESDSERRRWKTGGTKAESLARKKK